MVSKYKTIVEAIQIESGFANKQAIEQFFRDGQQVYGEDCVTFHFACGICEVAYPGWWIVKDYKGRYDAVSPEEFAKDFEKVAERR